jgi:signal transduction histidine kinase
MAAMRALLRRAEPEETREQIEKRLDRAEGIVGGIMSFTRATLRDGDVERTDLMALVEAVVDEHDKFGDDVTLQDGDRLFVRCRFNAIERVVQNVVSNGVKYGQRVRVAIAKDDDMAVIRVDDDGPGIPPEMRDAVFEPFRRISDDIDAPEGTGLGLAIVKSIVVDHGGTVSLTNRAGGGLRLEIRLPV